MNTNDIHTLPGASIILCVRNEAQNLQNYLHAFLTQDYPTYEVILIDNCSQDSTRAEIEDYQHRDPRVRMVQIPQQAWITDARRLTQTLGAKAAQYDHLLFVNPDCRPESNQWLKLMMAPFVRDSRVEVVLGRSSHYHEPGFLNGFIRMARSLSEQRFSLMTALRHPRRGCCRNYACTKAHYFRSLQDRYVFWRWNTVVQNDPEAWLWSESERTFNQWFKHKYLYNNGRKQIGY